MHYDYYISQNIFDTFLKKLINSEMQPSTTLTKIYQNTCIVLLKSRYTIYKLMKLFLPVCVYDVKKAKYLKMMSVCGYSIIVFKIKSIIIIHL